MDEQYKMQGELVERIQDVLDILDETGNENASSRRDCLMCMQ